MASNLRTEIDRLLGALAADLDALLERHAIEFIAERLGLPLLNGRAQRPASRSRRTARAAKPSGEGSAAEQIISYVKAHPGEKSEAVRDALGVSKGTWAYNVAKALATKQIRRKGIKRASTLFPT